MGDWFNGMWEWHNPLLKEDFDVAESIQLNNLMVI